MSQCAGGDTLTLAREAWVARDLWQAKRYIEEALASQPANNEKALTLLTAGVVYRELGDLHLAQQCFEDIRNGWSEYLNLRPVIEGYVLYNLGLVYYQRREFTESCRCNEFAAEQFRREHMPSHRRRALQNLAWSQCCLGDGAGALQSLQVAEEEGLIKVENTEAWWQQRIGMVFAAYADGGYLETMDLAADILKAKTAEPDVLCHAAWLAGRAALALQRYETAVQLANAATQWALDANDSRCLSDAQRLRIEVAQHKATQGA